MSEERVERKGFRQRSPPFLKYLQSILRKYPDGGQILKELVQNADDASAKEVILLYDERTFGTQRLFSEGLASAQGPALLAYNNSLFSEADWDGIQSPGLSHKVDDPSTVGRFGLGFNSVYHITDFPSMLSGHWLGVLDPQRTALNDGGQLWSVDEWEEASDQFEPFWAVLKSLGRPYPPTEGHFPGTLFRFPLRHSPSGISENLYSPERARELLLAFLDDAPLSLLFLRNVQRVTLGLIGSDGTIYELLRAESTSHSPHGSNVGPGIPGCMPGIVEGWVDRSGAANGLLHGPDLFDSAKLDTAVSITTLALCGTEIRQAAPQDWLVVSAVAKKDAFPELWDLADSVSSEPTLSLAYPLQGGRAGRLSCVLPLPATEENATSLPLHISAPFQLTDDRRHVQWSEEGAQARSQGARWNHLLIEEMLPVAYSQVLQLASGYPRDPYGAWPDPDQSQQLRYKALVARICQRLMDMKLLVRAGDGDPRLLLPGESVLFPETVVDKPMGQALEKALILAGSQLVVAPPHVHRALKLGAKGRAEMPEATAGFAREILRMADHIWSKIPAQEKLLLLEYMTEDGCYQALKGLPLVPMANGHFARFGDSAETVFVETCNFPRVLLPGLAHRFLPQDLNPVLQKRLQAIAEQKIFSNLVALNQLVVEQNIRAALPKDWVSSNSNPVTWYLKAFPNHPPLEWLAAFWTFLTRPASSLVPFEGCPLIPLTSLHHYPNGIQLARLLPRPTLLLQSHNGLSLSAEVVGILQALGCTMIQSWQPNWFHQQLRNYILDPVPGSALQAFAHLGVSSVADCLVHLSTCQIESLSTFLSRAASLSREEAEVLRALPLFCKLPSLLPPCTPGLVPAGSHLALEKNLVPPVPKDLWTPHPVLLCRNEADRCLLLCLRENLLGAPDLGVLCVKAMKNGAYAGRAQEARGVMLWVLHNADTLFSQSQELQRLCHDLPFLDSGSGKLARPSDLYDPANHTLRDLLRPHCFPSGPFQEPGTLRALRTLGLKSDLMAVSPADALTAAQDVAQLQEATVANAKSQALIRVCNEAPLLSHMSSQELKLLQCLAWVPAINPSVLVPAGCFVAPAMLRSEKHAALVGLAMGLTNAFQPHAAKALGLEKTPPPEKVGENLACLARDCLPEGTLELIPQLHSIYQHMQQHMSNFQKPPAGPAVWNGNGFSLPGDMVLGYPDGLDLAALVPRVPSDFQRYGQLFATWGVRPSPNEEEVCQALHQLADRINPQSHGGTQAELHLVVAALDWFRSRDYHGGTEMLVPMQVPGQAGFALQPASSALYCDMDRTRLADLDGPPPALVHEAVPPATAVFLNVEMLSARLSGLELFEAWGPSEPVTLRIRNILHEYCQDADVFQELLQNAEDAGAKICHFLVDLRPHNGTTEGLLAPGMAACQGPALWAHNDALFSDADFTNIIRLGAATKERQHDKIGHFGLGFCTVYHVTDAPSILSSHTVVIFDPNVTHLQKHIRDASRPGIRLKLSPQTVAVFPEQFRPYRGIFGCQIGKDYQGTLIRLPFRTEQEARDSEICSQPFGPKRIKELQAGFQEMYQHLLIFLHSVQEVSLAHLPGGSSSPEAAQPLATVIRRPLDKMSAPDIVQLTASWESNVAISHYLLHSCSGTGEALKLFQGGGKESFSFSPPVASVALPLRPTCTPGQWSPDLENFEGRVFCFLPLPIESGLPLHLTAAFAVLSNRKGLWDTTEKGQWNRALLRDSVLGAWLGALCRLRDMCMAGLLEHYEYHTFWPDAHKAKHSFSEAAQAFYQALVDGVEGEQPILLSDGHRWCAIQHACFLDADIICEKQLKPTATRVFSSLLPEPKMAVSLPCWVKLSFRRSTLKNVLSPNTYNWARFLRELVLPNLAELAAPDRDALILRALDMKDASVDEALKSLPCIPATPNDQLKHISGLVNPKGRAAWLYTCEDGRFPTNAEFLKPERLFHLVELGMAQDSVTMEELISRARSVADLWHREPQKACLRARHILHLLKDHLQESFSNTAQVIFREIPFLPAKLPGNCNRLCCPNQIYHYKLQPLVGLIEPVLAKDLLGEGQILSSELKEFLGLSRQPPVSTVLMQLEAMSRGSNALSRTELAKTTQSCYAFLNGMVHKNAPCRLEVFQKARAFPFVLVGSNFVPVHSVAHHLAFDAAPYLFQLPQEYQQQKELWSCIGIPSTFQVEDYASVLQTLAKKAGGKALSKGQLDLVIRLITVGLVGALPEGQDLDPVVAQSISFPDAHEVLRPLPKLLFDDSPWLPRERGTLLCHPMISREVALRCRIPTTRHHMLSCQQMQGFSQWATNFGAKEDRNTRLASILREYSSFSRDVLRELLQNADDAGASVVHFLWDQRRHPTHRIFGDNWKDLQGPALCIYNNQTFEMRDIEGIQHLGSGGKGGRQDTTGKFGLGFNTVYHLTDCPAFVTGNSALCVFDPTLRYVPCSNDVSPGGKFSLTKDFKDTFQDVYDTFLPEVFDLEHGTVFRLPLRTPAGAAASPICQRSVSKEDVSSMLEALAEEADCLMMFLNHVHRVVFSVIKENQTVPEEVFWVETNGGEPERLEYQKQFHQAAVAGGMAVGEPVRVFYRMKVNSSFSSIANDWLVGRQIGVDSLATVEGVHLPHGGVAACLNRQPEGRAFCTLPLPVKTGLPVHINGNFSVDSGRRDLWKDDNQDSPEMVWNSFLLQNLVAPLYLHLLEELRKALGKPPLLFSSLNTCQERLDSSYLRHFPLVTDHVSLFWHQLVNHVYKLAIKRLLSLVPVYQKGSKHRMEEVRVSWSVPQWGHPTKDPYFLPFEINGSLEVTLQNLGMGLVPAFQSLQKIRDQFIKAGIEVLTLDSPSLCCFLRSLSGLSLPCTLNQTPLKNTSSCSALLNFCLEGLPSNDTRCLEGLPLLLTRDGVLRRFSQQDPVYQSSAHALFPRHKDRFSACLISPEAKLLLVETGFMKEFTLSESAVYIQERLTLNDWGTGADKGRAWLRSVWAFFEQQICASGNQDTMNQMFQKLVSLFKDRNVLPVCGSGEDLVPLDSLNIVMGFPDDVFKILSKLGFASLDFSLLPSQLTRNCILPKLFQTDDPASVLVQLSAQSSLHWEALEYWDFETLLWHLCKDQKKLVHTDGLLNKLKALPIFETHQGQRVPLALYQNMYLLQSKIPEMSKNFSELYEADERIVLLKDNFLNRKLSECLDIVVMNDLQQFVQLLLPFLQLLPEARLLEAVNLLLTIKARYPEYKDQKATVVSEFQSLAFIRDKQGVLRPASYFYDSSVDLFQKMGLDSQFVPDEFYKTVGSRDKQKVFGFLKDVGLKQDASENDFLQFAVQIESEALKNGAMSDELPDKRGALLSHLLSKKSDSLSDAFLDQLSKIRFLAPRVISDELCKLHSPFVSHNMAVAPRDSLYNRGKTELTWTAAVILHPVNILNTYKEAIWARLRVQCTLSAQLVLKNLSNVCQTQCNSQETKTTRARVLHLMYDYLMEQESIETECVNGLPVVLVDGDEVAEAQHVVVALANWNEFRPYLYRLYPKLAPYRELLEKFGVKVEPTIHHYASVLARIYKETMQKDTLQPNLIKTVMRATRCFFQLLANATETADVSDLKELHLPCTDGKLYPSNTLVFNDCATDQSLQALQSTFHFLVDHSKDYPSFEKYHLSKLLPRLPVSLQPQKLSAITREQLDELSLELCPYGVHCEFQSHLKELLVAPEFHSALVALLRWQNTTKEEAEVDEIPVGLFLLDRLEVICCEKVFTVMVHNSQCLEGSQEAKTVYVVMTADGKQCIYLEHQDSLAGRQAVKVSETLAKEVNRLLGEKLGMKAMSVLREILACQAPEEIMDVLDEHKVTLQKPNLRDAFTLPDPGEEIPEEWHDSLDMSILHSFMPGDYVGYLDPSLQGERYVYAVVLEALGQKQSGVGQVHMYCVDVGGGQHLEVSAHDLYHFQWSKLTSDSSRALVSVPSSSEGAVAGGLSGGDWFQQPLDEVKEKLDACLAESWKLSKEERKKAIRRLYLCYHPDKNLGHEVLAGEIFKYLKEKIKELENMEKLKDCTRGPKSSSPFKSNSWNFSKHWNEWDQQASRHQERRQTFTRQRQGRRGGGNFTYDFWSYHTPGSKGYQSKSPGMEEARRWLRQAECDLRAAANDVANASTEWLLYKTYRAVEKALTAVEYKQGGRFDNNLSVAMLAAKVAVHGHELAVIRGQVAKLRQHGMDEKTTQYPRYHPTPTIPNDAFNTCKEQEVLLLGQEILDTVQRWLGQ